MILREGGFLRGGKIAAPIAESISRVLAPINPIFQASLTSTLVPERATGSGTPTLTRATTGTVVDHEGLVRTALAGEARFTGARRVRNLLTSAMPSEGNLNVAEGAGTGRWNVSAGITASAGGQSDPLGGTNATKVTVGSSGSIWPRLALDRARKYRFSVWLRADTGTYQLRLSATDTVTWTTSVVSSTLTLDTTWRRYSLLVDGAAQGWSGTNIDFNTGSEGKTPFPITVGAFHIWGAQIEDVTGQSNENPSEYVSVGVLSAPYHGAGVDGVKYFTTQNGNTVASNVVTEATGAAISSSTLLGYLAEGQRTNLALRSQEFDNATWAKTDATVTANAAVAPDGTTTADKIVESANTAVHFVGQDITVTTGTAYTVSAYMKESGRRYAGLFLSLAGFADNGRHVTFDLQNGTVGTTQAGVTATITSVGGGVYRCTATATSDASATGTFGIYLSNADAIAPSYLGDGTSGVLVWGFQLEAASFASSYIPTTTAAVTRNADVLTYAGSGNVLAAQGTAFAEVTITQVARPDANVRVIALGAAGEGVLLNSSSQPRVFDGTTFGDAGLSSLSVNSVTKIAGTWAGSSVRAYKDGTAGNATAFDGSMGGTTVAIGNDPSDATRMFGNIRNVKIYGRALSDAQVAAL